MQNLLGSLLYVHILYAHRGFFPAVQLNYVLLHKILLAISFDSVQVKVSTFYHNAQSCEQFYAKSECFFTGCQSQAWEDTYRNWDAVTRYLELYPKVKYEEQGRGEIAEMIKLKRKTPQHANTEHELEVSNE